VGKVCTMLVSRPYVLPSRDSRSSVEFGKILQKLFTSLKGNPEFSS